MLVANDYLQVTVGDLLVCRHDDSNHKVEHNNLQEVGLTEEDQPNEVDVNINENTWLLGETLGILLQNFIVCRQCQLTDGVTECFQQGLAEVVEN